MVFGCPRQGFNTLTLIRFFYDGFHPSVQQFVEESGDGRFSDDVEAVWELL